MIIRQHLVTSNKAAKVTNGRKNTKRKICIHETGNKNKGANAAAHARLQANGNSRNASWHWSICDKEAVQSFTHDYQCWAAGTGIGNNEAIHIEICVNSDGDYKKAVMNAVELCAKICKEEGLTEKDLVQHSYYSGKNCPEQMRKVTAPIPWHTFVQMVKSNLTEGSKVKGKYELVEDKESKVWRIQSGTFKTKAEAIKAFEKSGLPYATIRGSIK